ncbi:MAG TPA: Asp-tRNA(Asn)/Glu-tRNA(Gln) amidotransferase subunit GatB [Candidatus Dormibacteraeota bacterium]|nr:Asp-tRNA(Asn)/Glu-tRNA(Gln) amidotransferase subunit GatB [Candidatus Dormibacteraeota bacterium]
MTSIWEPVIGLEVHAQLLTASKMFCGCRAQYLGIPPNSNTCPVCLGLPGTLPVINQVAVELTIRTALALNCEIPEFSKFDRKNYFYPDLPKGYQISQFDLPLSINGCLEFEVEGRVVRAGITRVHLEEDAGTLHHAGEIHNSAFSLVDLNRAGVPLMEIVGEPDLRHPAEAPAYLAALRQTLIYLGVNDGNMEEGSLRCDANISLRRRGTSTLGAKVEVKNMNSFRSIQRALEFELARQTELLEQDQPVAQETRGWSDLEQVTVSQRSKEEAQEYRYFPEPDLPPLVISRAYVEELRAALPELPRAARRRLQERYQLTADQARLIAETAADAAYFEAVVAAGAVPHAAANWQVQNLQALCNAAHVPVSGCRVLPGSLAELVTLVVTEQVSGAVAKEVLAEIFESGARPAEVVASKGLGQVSDTDRLATFIEEALAGNQKAAADYQSGNDRALGSLVGAVMALSKGTANPKLVSQLLRDRLPRS